MARTGLVSDLSLRKHATGVHHPEQPARVDAVLQRFHTLGLSASSSALQARSASDDELALAHDRRYLRLVHQEIAAGRSELSTGETVLSPDSEEVARLATGCALTAVDAVFSGAVENAFAVIRPPGHHASADIGMGFCLFNHVAVAARYARHRWSAERVLIVDWDVHHGNGTQDIFYRDGSVLFFSTHQSPWYPGTGAASEVGEGAGHGTTLNCPFPAGAGETDILGAMHNVLAPAAYDFRPDLILISAGFDSRKGDPLGRFTLSDASFHNMTDLVLQLAASLCNGRVVSLLEGGYSLQGLASASAAHLSALQGKACPSAEL